MPVPRKIQGPGQSAAGVEDDMIDVEIREEHTTRVLETEDHFKAVKTVQEHNRRLTQMIIWTRSTELSCLHSRRDN